MFSALPTPAKIRAYLAHDLWHTRLSGEPRWRRWLLRQLQLWVLVCREFLADRCLLHAAALSFTTLLSIVPLLALTFAVLKGFGMQNRLEPLLIDYLAAGSESAAAAIVAYINNTDVARLGVIGLIALGVSALSLLAGIEKTFNDIWGVVETRSVLQRFGGFFAVVVIAPILVATAISMTGTLASHTLAQRLIDRELAGELLILLFKVTPFAAMWLVFAGLYLFIPNARVLPRAALVGGVFGGTLWQFSQWAYVHFQFGVSRYNAIYGTLSALPVFMIWLFLAWVIVLLGLQVAYAVQHLQSVRRDLRGGKVSVAGRTRVILAVLVHLAIRFQRGQPPCSGEELAAALQIPPRLLAVVMEMLQRLELVAEVTAGQGGRGYLPAREPHALPVSELLARIVNEGADYLPPLVCAERAAIVSLVERLGEGAGSRLDGLTLGDLVDEVEAGGTVEGQEQAGG